MLVKAGHSWGDIRKYPLSAVGVFVRAEVQRQKEEQATNIIAVAHGTNTTGKKLKSVIDDILREKQPKGSYNEPDMTPKTDGLRLMAALKGR